MRRTCERCGFTTEDKTLVQWSNYFTMYLCNPCWVTKAQKVVVERPRDVVRIDRDII